MFLILDNEGAVNDTACIISYCSLWLKRGTVAHLLRAGIVLGNAVSNWRC